MDSTLHSTAPTTRKSINFHFVNNINNVGAPSKPKMQHLLKMSATSIANTSSWKSIETRSNENHTPQHARDKCIHINVPTIGGISQQNSQQQSTASQDSSYSVEQDPPSIYSSSIKFRDLILLGSDHEMKGKEQDDDDEVLELMASVSDYHKPRRNVNHYDQMIEHEQQDNSMIKCVNGIITNSGVNGSVKGSSVSIPIVVPHVNNYNDTKTGQQRFEQKSKLWKKVVAAWENICTWVTKQVTQTDEKCGNLHSDSRLLDDIATINRTLFGSKHNHNLTENENEKNELNIVNDIAPLLWICHSCQKLNSINKSCCDQCGYTGDIEQVCASVYANSYVPVQTEENTGNKDEVMIDDGGDTNVGNKKNIMKKLNINIPNDCIDHDYISQQSDSNISMDPSIATTITIKSGILQSTPRSTLIIDQSQYSKYVSNHRLYHKYNGNKSYYNCNHDHDNLKSQSKHMIGSWCIENNKKSLIGKEHFQKCIKQLIIILLTKTIVIQYLLQLKL